MPIRLNIEAENVAEFDELISRFSRSGDTAPVAAAAPTPSPAAESGTGNAGTTTRRRASSKTADASAATGEAGASATSTASPETTSTSTTAASPSDAPTPQPTANGTAASPAESIAPNQPVDTGTVTGQAAADTNAAAVTPTPSAGSAVEGAGGVTYDMLKDAMTGLLKVKSAGVAQQTLRDATGAASLSSLKPEQYATAHAALVAAAA